MSSIVETIAEKFGVKPEKLTLDMIRKGLPDLRRTMAQYEKEAVDVEKQSIAVKNKAYAPDTPLAERVVLIQKAAQLGKAAAQKANFAAVFIKQYDSFSSLETAMQIAQEMQNVGLFDKAGGAIDWQRALDEMQVEINAVAEMCDKLGDAVSIAIPGMDAVDPVAAGEAGELEALFKKLSETTDPVEQAEIQKKIDKVAGLATV